MPELLVPIIIIAACAGLTIYGKYSNTKLYYVFKPATSILILAMPLILILPEDLYSWLMLAGLLAALIGDVFLMIPDRHFTKGLAAFLTTHILYIAAFISISMSSFWLLLIPFFAFAILMYSKLKIGEDKLRIPVLIYTAVISIMGFTAANVWLGSDSQLTFLIFIAALLFILSDSVLAYNKFTAKFKSAELIILSSYYLAQTIFAVTIILAGKG